MSRDKSEKALLEKASSKTLMRLRIVSRKKMKFSDLSVYEDQEYIELVKDILVHPKFHQMQQYIMHGKTSCQEHCIVVSYLSYKFAKRFGLDCRAVSRAGLLHDMFLYDWHEHPAKTGDWFHGITHPRVALTYASHYFRLNECEMDIILKHMWPLTIIPPKYMEGYIVSMMDKYSTVSEVILKKFELLDSFIRR